MPIQGVSEICKLVSSPRNQNIHRKSWSAVFFYRNVEAQAAGALHLLVEMAGSGPWLLSEARLCARKPPMVPHLAHSCPVPPWPLEALVFMTLVLNMLWKPRDLPPVQSPSGRCSPSAYVHGTVLSNRRPQRSVRKPPFTGSYSKGKRRGILKNRGAGGSSMVLRLYATWPFWESLKMSIALSFFT